MNSDYVPNPSDMGHGPIIMGVLWTLTAIALLVVGARMYVRAKMGIPSWDDWIMLVAALLQIVVMGFITTAYTYGLGKHDRDLQFDDMVNILKWSWLNMIPGTFVAVLARVSSAIFLCRLFGVRLWFKWFLIVWTIIQCIGGAVVLLTNFLQATPIESLWNPMVTNTSKMPAGAAQIVAYTVQALFTVSDLTYVLFPVAIIWRLNMSLSRRIGLCLLMCTSLISAAASIMKATTIQTVSSNTTEPQYVASIAALWSNVEQTLVIIMACVPLLRAFNIRDMPLFSRIASSFSSRFGSSRYGSKKSSEGGASGGNTGGSSHHGHHGGGMIRTPAGYYHDLEMNTHKLGHLHSEKSYGGAVEATFKAVGGGNNSSQSLVGKEEHYHAEPCVRRTDQFTVSWENTKPPATATTTTTSNSS